MCGTRRGREVVGFTTRNNTALRPGSKGRTGDSRDEQGRTWLETAPIISMLPPMRCGGLVRLVRLSRGSYCRCCQRMVLFKRNSGPSFRTQKQCACSAPVAPSFRFIPRAEHFLLRKTVIAPELLPSPAIDGHPGGWPPAAIHAKAQPSARSRRSAGWRLIRCTPRSILRLFTHGWLHFWHR